MRRRIARTAIFVGSVKVGYVRQGVFCKVIRGSRHLLTEPVAIGYSVASLEQAERLGASKLEVLDAETGVFYRADLVQFRKHAFPVQRGRFEAQLAMRVEHWRGGPRRAPAARSKAKRAGKLTTTPEPQEPPEAPATSSVPAQLPMFKDTSISPRVTGRCRARTHAHARARAHSFILKALEE